ncbi:endocuticle structural glycoprotein SgAbd-3-like [Battus philenor]|uniref:endocuticle structural glycoprotein SgAbd-3-like n=1 Tax=Battus philenor TaxID=42288 RepID=UPI0035CF0E5D
MKYFIVLTLATIASSARLDKVYLPAHSESDGANVGLLTPLESAQSSQTYPGPEQSFPPASVSSQAQILRYENDINADGYHYAYETSDGTKAEQNGRVIPGAAPEEGSLQVSGSYTYVGEDGQTYTITYTADENGYHAVGDHLPTQPPIPEEILKSLQLTAGTGGQYDSKKSSYDADAGY